MTNYIEVCEMLKSGYSLFIVAPLIISSAAVAEKAGKQFDGLWEGIDGVDGSSVQISIVCEGNGDGACRVIGRESYLNYCEQHSAGGEGWYEGMGQVAKGKKKHLEIRWAMHCQDGISIDVDAYFISNRAKKILILGGEGFQDITLHRVSN